MLFHGVVDTYVETAIQDATKITEAIGIDKERRYEMNSAECRMRDELSLPSFRWTSLAKSAGFARKRRHHRPRVVLELVWMR